MINQRMARVTQQFTQEIALIIQRELQDPRVGFVTITRVELSKDLRYAKVFFSYLGNEADRARSHDALERSARYIHGLLKKRFRLKIIPMLRFHYDASIEGAITFSDTLERLKDSPPEGES